MLHKELVPSTANYVHFRVTETVAPTVLQELLVEIARSQKRDGVQRFLIDVREVQAETSAVYDYQLAYNGVIAVGIERPTRIALLTSLSDHTHDYAEIVGRNAGNNIILFRNKDKAVAWLQE